MSFKPYFTLLLFFSFFLLAKTAQAAIPAFPGAEGFGSTTVGGRGGKVYEVINLNDSGSGSLRACVESSGPRICVFRTGGTIDISNEIRIGNPYITIAGQTAPGDGILIKRSGINIRTHDVIIRGIRVRTGDEPNNQDPSARDSLKIEGGSGPKYNIIIDHSSFSWAIDETVSTWGDNIYEITFQWSIISEGLHNSIHPKGPHSKGFLIGDYTKRISFHHNLFANNDRRNPGIKGDTSGEVINNVIYNWGGIGTHFGSGDVTNEPVFANIVNNYYKAGPSSSASNAIYFHTGSWAINDSSRIYINGNVLPSTAPGDDWSGLPTKFRSLIPINLTGINTHTAEEAYNLVLAEAGSNMGLNCNGSFFERRGAHDARVITDVKQGTGKIIDSPSEVGGWLSLNPGTPCIDTDHDGMPNVWENQYSFNPNNISDGPQDADGDGYTNIEEYLNGTNPRGGGPTSTVVVTPTPVVTLPGDANDDGKVDVLDYVIWLNYYNQLTGNGSSDGDFNNSGSVGGLDYVIWLNNYSM